MALNNRTLGDVKDYVKRQFGDESGYQLTDDDITRWTNEACMEIVSKNEVLRAVTAVAYDPAVERTVPKPTDSLKILSVRWNDTLLKNIGFEEFQNLGYSLSGVTSLDKAGNACYWTQFSEDIVLGAYPLVAGTIEITYVPEPAKITLDGSTLELPDRYFSRVLEYVMSKAYEMDEDWSAHQVQRQMFEDNMSTLSNAENDTSGPYPVVVEYEY